MTVRRDGVEPDRLARVVGRRVGMSLPRPAGAPGVIRAAAAVQARSSSRTSSRLSRDDVEGGEMEPILSGRHDARLLGP